MQKSVVAKGVNARPKTKHIAAIAIFAVLYTVLRIVPTVPMIGAAGSFFSLSDVIAPLYGIILGPFIGGASVILGTFLAIALGRPITFLGLDFLPATVNAVAVGFLMRRRRSLVIGVFTLLLALALINPLTLIFVKVPFFGQELSVPFYWMHFVAFIALVSPLSKKAGNWVTTTSLTRLAPGIAVLVFIGTMMQHTTGNILFEVILGSYLGVIKPEAFPLNWSIIFYIYPIERTLLIVVATFIGTPLVRALTASRLLNLQPYIKP